MPRFSELLSLLSRCRRATTAFTLALALSAASSAAPIKAYPTLKLKDGRTFKAVEIINYTGNAVLVRHAGGATTFRYEVLPSDVIADLHLEGWEAFAPAGVDASLADRPAVAEANLADKPAVAESVALPAHASHAASAPSPAWADKPAAPAAVTPSGEGNIPEFFSATSQPIPARTSATLDVAGRVVVAPPSGGTYLLGDIEVRGYPAELLATYLQQARAKAQAAARILRDEAAVAAQQGRRAESLALEAKAARVARQVLDHLPAAPVTARSDEFGNFTLRHTIPDLRIVATGRIEVPRGEWSYEWVGVPVGREAHLTEANATAISTAGTPGSRYAAR